MCVSLRDWNKQIGWRFIFENLSKKDKVLCTNDGAEVTLNLILDRVSLQKYSLLFQLEQSKHFYCMDTNFLWDEALNNWSKTTSPIMEMRFWIKLCKLLLILLLTTNFGVYVRVLWFCFFYLTLFYSDLKMSILNLIWHLRVFQIYIGKH